jgi:hypothetical protein
MTVITDDFAPAVLKEEDKYEGKDVDANIAAGKSTGRLNCFREWMLSRTRSSTQGCGDSMGVHAWRDSLVCLNEDRHHNPWRFQVILSEGISGCERKRHGQSRV